MFTLYMKQNKITTTPSQNKLVEYKRRVAFHEAGRAAGIYLNNKARNMPSIPFKIIFKEMSCVAEVDVTDYKAIKDNYIAQLEGGRLIEMLPHSFDSWAYKLTEHNKAMVPLVKDYRIAFESDIINLLIAPLAEAKHIADHDNEIFKLQLINAKALKYYGGNSGLALLNEYLQCYFANRQKDEKLDELFIEAFYFVNNDANWLAITRLADYILGSINSICYEDIVSMLDQSIVDFKERRAKVRHHCDRWFKVTAQHIESSYAKSTKNIKRPSQAELNTMSQSEKDALILKLFDFLEELT
ncbi:MAG: hypothetical protein WAW61_09425 [Methylococcaceae bacterium]